MLEVECAPAPPDGGPLNAELLEQLGPTLAVKIGFDPQYRPALGAVPDLPSTPHMALVDTGASLGCIDSELAASLGLPIVNRRDVSGVHGALTVNMHLVPQLH